MRKLNEIPDSDIRIFGSITLKRLAITGIFLMAGLFLGIYLNRAFKYPCYVLSLLLGLILSNRSKDNHGKTIMDSLLYSVTENDYRTYYPEIAEQDFNKKGKPIKMNRISKILPFKKGEKNKPMVIDKYFDIMEIEACDVINLNEGNSFSRMSEFTEFNRSYHDDYKIISTINSNDYSQQKEYIKYLLSKEPSQKKRVILKNKLTEYEYLESTTVKKEFDLLLYGSSPEDIKDNKNKAKNLMKMTKLKEIPDGRAEEVFKKLYSV